MPYITQEDRKKYDDLVDALIGELTSSDDQQLIKGHHNYIMYTLALKLADSIGVRYATLQDIIGTFDCCKMEFYRKIVAKYEEKAIEKNGDVTLRLLAGTDNIRVDSHVNISGYTADIVEIGIIPDDDICTMHRGKAGFLVDWDRHEIGDKGKVFHELTGDRSWVLRTECVLIYK